MQKLCEHKHVIMSEGKQKDRNDGGGRRRASLKKEENERWEVVARRTFDYF